MASKPKSNENLGSAKVAKKDEFYTQLTDIEKELRYYTRHFAGKTVLCNCDDPFESNFFKYFVLNFKRLGLKKLIATCYTGSPIEGGRPWIDLDDSGTRSDIVIVNPTIGTVRSYYEDKLRSGYPFSCSYYIRLIQSYPMPNGIH